MRKALLVLLILALAISLFPKTKITFWTMSLKPRFTDFVESLVSDYESLHPDVDVVWEDVPWDVLIQKLMAAVAAGDGQDAGRGPAGGGLHVLGSAQGRRHKAPWRLDRPPGRALR